MITPPTNLWSIATQRHDIRAPIWVFLIGISLGPISASLLLYLVLDAPWLVPATISGDFLQLWLAVTAMVYGWMLGLIPATIATGICLVPWGGTPVSFLRLTVVSAVVGTLFGLAVSTGVGAVIIPLMIIGSLIGCTVVWLVVLKLGLIVQSDIG